jgi:hypothetical protein
LAYKIDITTAATKTRLKLTPDVPRSTVTIVSKDVMVVATPQNDKIEIQIKLMEVASKEYLQLELNAKRHQPAFVSDSNTVEFYFESRQQRNNADCVLQAHFADGSMVATPYYFKIKQRGGRSGSRTPKKQKTSEDSMYESALIPQIGTSDGDSEIYVGSCSNIVVALARLSVSNDLCPDAGCQGALVRMENVKRKEDVTKMFFGDRNINPEDLKELEGEVYFKVPDLLLNANEKRSVRIIIFTDQPFLYDFLYYQRATLPQKGKLYIFALLILLGVTKKTPKKRKEKQEGEESDPEEERGSDNIESTDGNLEENSVEVKSEGEAVVSQVAELTKGTFFAFLLTLK